MGAITSRCCPESNQEAPEKDGRHNLFVKAKDRKCTDCFCLFFLLLFWVIWLGIACIAVLKGNPEKLVYGRDYAGCLCGSDNTNVNSEATTEKCAQVSSTGGKNNQGELELFYPRLNEDIYEFTQNTGIGISASDIASLNPSILMSMNLTGVCVETCPKKGDVVCTDKYISQYKVKPTTSLAQQCKSNMIFRNSNMEMCNNCWYVALQTTNILHRCLEIVYDKESSTEVCTFPLLDNAGKTMSASSPDCIAKEVVKTIMSDAPAYPNPVAELLGDALSKLGQMVNDVDRSKLVIFLIGGPFPLLLGFLWIMFLRHFARSIIWGTIYGVMIGLAIADMFMWWNAGMFADVYCGDRPMCTNTTTVTTTSSESTTDPVTGQVNTVIWELSEQAGIDASSTDNTTYYQWGAIALMIFWVILCCCIIYVRKKIQIMIAIVQESTNAMVKMPGLVIFPWVTAVQLVILGLYFIVILAYITTTDLSAIAEEAQASLGCNATMKALTDPYAVRRMLSGIIYGSSAISMAHHLPLTPISQVEFPIDNTMYTNELLEFELKHHPNPIEHPFYKNHPTLLLEHMGIDWKKQIIDLGLTPMELPLHMQNEMYTVSNSTIGVGKRINSVIPTGNPISENILTRGRRLADGCDGDTAALTTDTTMKYWDGTSTVAFTTDSCKGLNFGEKCAHRCNDNYEYASGSVTCISTGKFQIVPCAFDCKGYTKADASVLKVKSTNDACECKEGYTAGGSGTDLTCTGKAGHCDDKFTLHSKYLPECTSTGQKNCINTKTSLMVELTANSSGTCINMKTGESCSAYTCQNPSGTDYVDFEGGSVVCNPDKSVTVTPCVMTTESTTRYKSCNSLGEAQQESETYITVIQVFHFFGYLWTNELLIAISGCCIAGAVCKWYWTRPRQSEKKNLGKHVVYQSVYRTYRFHIGSLAAGSFIIAVVQIIRYCIMYLDQQTKGLQQTNIFIKAMFKVIHCCLWCFEKSLKFFMEDAYIIIAMRGYSFCKAGREVIFIILENLEQLAIATVISEYVCLLGKILISIASVMAGWSIITNVYTADAAKGTEAVQPIVPCICVLILAYFMADSFLEVYSHTMNTILICFIEDKKIHAENPKKSFYPTLLYKVLVKKEDQDEAHLEVSESDNESDTDSAYDDDDSYSDTESKKGKSKKKKGNKVVPVDSDDDDDSDVVEIL